MADGPCGEQFKAAFSCFVYSEAEPKGMDCVEKFKGMQDCFREHPEIYGEGTSLFSSISSPSLSHDHFSLRMTDSFIEEIANIAEIDDDEPESAGVPEGKNPERPIPKAPNANPPENSPVLGVTPGEFPSKGTYSSLGQ
jgi:intermembrane space import and assembly protein 40